MQHTGLVASLLLPLACLSGILVAVAIADWRIKAHRRALGRERRLWFDYATLAARTARELRGE